MLSIEQIADIISEYEPELVDVWRCSGENACDMPRGDGAAFRKLLALCSDIASEAVVAARLEMEQAKVFAPSNLA